VVAASFGSSFAGPQKLRAVHPSPDCSVGLDRVREVFVGLIDLLQTLFSRAISGIAIRMVLAGQGTIGSLDDRLLCVAVNAEGSIVVVKWGHDHPSA
jgi:hypothetical protein